MALVPWRAVLVSGVLISVAGLVVGQAGVARLIVVVGFVAILVRTMRINRSIATGPWRLLLVGGVLALVQAIARGIHGGVVDQEYPFPSVADAIGLAAYAVMMAGGVSMVRVRTRERRRENSTDAMIFAAVTGMITLNVFLAPYLHDGTVPVDERLLVLVYAVSTLGLTAMAARISFGPGVRNEAYYLLALSVSVMGAVRMPAIIDLVTFLDHIRENLPDQYAYAMRGLEIDLTTIPEALFDTTADVSFGPRR